MRKIEKLELIKNYSVEELKNKLNASVPKDEIKDLIQLEVQRQLSELQLGPKK